MIRATTMMSEGARAAAAATSTAIGLGWITEALATDILVAVLGAFFAGVPGSRLTVRLWDIVRGLAAGIALALIMRGGDANDLVVRSVVFGAAAFSTKISGWVDTPATFARDAEQIAKGIKAILSVIPKIGGK